MTFDESASNKERIFVTAFYWPLKNIPGMTEIQRHTSHRSAQGTDRMSVLLLI
jgi:hypothetical protein